MVRRYALRDDQWVRIAGLLPGREGHVGVTSEDNRLFVEAVLYRYRAGIPWRDLPERLGHSEAGTPSPQPVVKDRCVGARAQGTLRRGR